MSGLRFLAAALLLALAPLPSLAATPIKRSQIMWNAAKGMGYSYWYAVGKWRADGLE